MFGRTCHSNRMVGDVTAETGPRTVRCLGSHPSLAWSLCRHDSGNSKGLRRGHSLGGINGCGRCSGIAGAWPATQRRYLRTLSVQRSYQVSVVRLRVWLSPQVNEVFPSDPRGSGDRPVASAKKWNELPVILLSRDLPGDHVALVSHAAFAFVGASLVSGRADNQNKLIVANRAFHERWQLITRGNVPLVEHDIHSVASQACG